ncbi:hypothetical protein ACTTZI_004188 [Vibrio vulnificus]
MLKIIHGVYAKPQGELNISDFSNFFIKSKFQGSMNGVLVFSALVDETFNTQIIVLDDGGILKLSHEKVFAPMATRTSNSPQRRVNERSPNSLRKQLRKEHNKVITERNWKQFIGSKHSVFRAVGMVK